MRILIILLFGLFVSSSIFAEDATVEMLNKLEKENMVFSIKIVKVDVDSNPQAASRFGIRNIPTLFVFKDGEKVDSVMGLQPKAELAKVLDKQL